MLPRLATFCSRMTSIAPASVLIGVGQQRQKTRALDGDRELALVEGLRAGDAARDDLARLGDVALQGPEILVIDVGDAFGREAAKLLAAREAAAAATTAAAIATTFAAAFAVGMGCSAVHVGYSRALILRVVQTALAFGRQARRFVAQPVTAAAAGLALLVGRFGH